MLHNLTMVLKKLKDILQNELHIRYIMYFTGHFLFSQSTGPSF